MVTFVSMFHWVQVHHSIFVLVLGNLVAEGQIDFSLIYQLKKLSELQFPYLQNGADNYRARNNRLPKILPALLVREHMSHLSKHPSSTWSTRFQWTDPCICQFLVHKLSWISVAKNDKYWDFPGGAVVKNLPCNAWDVGSIPGWVAKIPHATEH